MITVDLVKHQLNGGKFLKMMMIWVLLVPNLLDSFSQLLGVGRDHLFIKETSTIF